MIETQLCKLRGTSIYVSLIYSSTVVVVAHKKKYLLVDTTAAVTLWSSRWIDCPFIILAFAGSIPGIIGKNIYPYEKSILGII